MAVGSNGLINQVEAQEVLNAVATITNVTTRGMSCDVRHVIEQARDYVF